MARLIIAIVNNLDAEHLVEVLRTEGHRLTEIPSFGGYFHAENTTLLIAVEDEPTERAVLDIIGRECSARDVEVPPEVSGGGDQPTFVRNSGATIFLADLRGIVQV
jgi:uncharacterized protein YaaQ